MLDHSLLNHKGGCDSHIPHHLVFEHITPHLGHAVADHSAGVVQIAVLAVDNAQIFKIRVLEQGQLLLKLGGLKLIIIIQKGNIGSHCSLYSGIPRSRGSGVLLVLDVAHP